MEAFMEEFQHLKISLEDIKSATGNFDERNRIGEGGFGPVYEGVVSHSKGQDMVAFKRLNSRYGQGNSEFMKEILILSRYTHENLISLLGFCDEGGEKILVYEHAFRGSLDRYLGSATLTWRQRLKICIAAAMGLCYLHDPKGTQQRVLHRDVKSSNILLDENWNAKVSDMGLSKISPANQPHTAIVSNPVGTSGYTDPVYAEHSILTKESDVYSFGVVLFEVLCGRLCHERKGSQFQNLVPTWRRTYHEKKLHEVIFEDLKQYMGPRSIETFSDIAYQCLHESREKRPQMYHVVEKLEIALRFQEDFEELRPSVDYEEVYKSSVRPLVYKSAEELKTILYKGILVNGGKTWFWLNNNGEHCEIISAAECVIPIQRPWCRYGLLNLNKSRFAWRFDKSTLYSKFRAHVRTESLSPHITYTVNLVFDTRYLHILSSVPLLIDIFKWVYVYPLFFKHIQEDFLSVSYTMAGETKSSTLCLPQKRKDGWLVSELYQFTSDNRIVDLEISFESRYPLIVEGIEFLPLETVPAEHEGLEDEEVEIQTISHPDIYWEHKLPTDYEQIIKLSKDRVQWTSSKELYSILCQGFAIKDGKEWFSLETNGKTCHKLPARAAFRESEWNWGSSPESRFEEVAFDPHGSFFIDCSSEILSPQTTYGSYLVYKLQESHRGFEHPVKVRYIHFGIYRHRSAYIYLLTPKIPVISPNYENTHNPLNRPKMKGLPQQRNDGWMEVQVREFRTGTTRKKISKNLHLTFYDNKSLKGLIVKGIEFRPI